MSLTKRVQRWTTPALNMECIIVYGRGEMNWTSVPTSSSSARWPLSFSARSSSDSRGALNGERRANSFAWYSYTSAGATVCPCASMIRRGGPLAQNCDDLELHQHRPSARSTSTACRAGRSDRVGEHREPVVVDVLLVARSWRKTVTCAMSSTSPPASRTRVAMLANASFDLSPGSSGYCPLAGSLPLMAEEKKQPTDRHSRRNGRLVLDARDVDGPAGFPPSAPSGECCDGRSPAIDVEGRARRTRSGRNAGAPSPAALGRCLPSARSSATGTRQHTVAISEDQSCRSGPGSPP